LVCLDDVKFGETVEAPPLITAAPRKAIKKVKIYLVNEIVAGRIFCGFC